MCRVVCARGWGWGGGSHGRHSQRVCCWWFGHPGERLQPLAPNWGQALK
jgi:hypothetical protein